MSCRRILRVGALVAVLFVHRAEAAPRKPVTLEIVFHIVDLESKPVADDAYLDARIERANEIFAPYGLAFTRTGSQPLGAAHALIEDAAGRDALAAEAIGRQRGVIDVFVVHRFRDVGDPSAWRRGVHWHSSTRRGSHYIILSASYGGRDVLAHELGHFLGNARHSETPGNLMCYQHGPELPTLGAAQIKRLERALRRYLSTHELRPAKPTAVATPGKQ